MSQIKTLDINHLIHPFVGYPRYKETGSMVFERAKGCYVYDENEKKYLDAIGGLWCVNIGYGRDEMADAIYEQVKSLPYYNTFTNMTNAPASKLAAKIIEHAPDNMSHVFFTTGGSVSNDTAVRIAHYYNIRRGKPNKKKIISRDSAYHGSTYLAASLTGITYNYDGFNVMVDDEHGFIHHLSAPNCYRKPHGLDDEAFCESLVDEFKQKIYTLGAEHIAAFIAEPIMGAGGVIVAPDHYFKRMWEVCKENDILFIADEVVTAFGRLGHMFSSEAVYGVKPDIICTAKGISSGYIPLGATIVSKEIHDVMSADAIGNKPFSHGFTYSCHPVACAAGLKNIEIIERESLCEGAIEVGDYLETHLKSLTDKSIVGDVRGKRLMMCIEFVQDKVSKKSFDASIEIGKRVAEQCYESGLIARNVGHYIILSPPLIITKEQIDWMIDVLAASIDTVTAELKNEGLLL